MPAEKQLALAPLPFGNCGDTPVRGDLEECQSFLQNLPEAPSQFDAIGKQEDFQIALRSIILPDLIMLAGSSTAKAVRHKSSRATFIIPFGSCRSVIYSGDQRHSWGSPFSGFFIPASVPVTAESSHGSFLRLEIHTEYLQKLFATTLGLDAEQPPELNIYQVQALPLRSLGINWQDRFRKLSETVEAYDCDSQQLITAGIDEVFVRTCLMLLEPDRLLNPPSEPKPLGRGNLDKLLEQIEENLADRICLSDLETWSERSARSIQHAFQQKLGMSPTRWILARRLERLRTLLLQAPSEVSIAELAQSCGLSRMATVIHEYTRRFGEKPSETRKRRGSWTS